MIFRGAATALVTPFKENGDIDYQAYEDIIDYQLENSIDALVVAATTGEAPVLTKEEKIKLIEIAMEKSNGKTPVIVGTGSNITSKAVESSKLMSDIGVDGLLVVTPYYNKATKKGLFEHYRLIAEAVDTPIILYTVPGRTGMNIPLETVEELAKVENIAGLKDATGDLAYAAHVRRLVPESFALYCGDDDLIVQTLSIGGDGVISVASNILPQMTHDMCYDYFNGDAKKAGQTQVKLMSLMKNLFIETSPAPAKSALDLIGLKGGDLRLPLTKCSEETTELLKKDLIELGVINA